MWVIWCAEDETPDRTAFQEIRNDESLEEKTNFNLQLICFSATSEQIYNVEISICVLRGVKQTLNENWILFKWTKKKHVAWLIILLAWAKWWFEMQIKLKIYKHFDTFKRQ